jgi:two-component system sensor histidine kinase KdpD
VDAEQGSGESGPRVDRPHTDDDDVVALHAGSPSLDLEPEMKHLRDWARNRRGAGFADSIVAVALATGAVAALDSVAPATGLGTVYLLAVLFVAIRRSEIAALATAVLSVLALNYFFIEPVHRLTIADSENVVALVVLLIAAIVVGRLALAARSRALEAEARAREAAAREREAELLAAAGSAVLAGTDIETQLANVGASVSASAGATSVRVELASAPSPLPGEFQVRLPTTGKPAWLYVSQDVGWELRDLDRVAAPLAKLIDVALERERVAARAAEAEATRLADLAKTAVLHAISHDLRSPMTGITAAAGALRGDRLAAADREELVSVIETEAARLARLVDDLFDLSRIEAGAVNPRMDWCDLQEAVVNAGRQAQAVQHPHPIDYALPQDLPLVKADPAQLERVFANLIENAIKFSPPDTPVRVTAGAGAGRVTVRVIDRGRGIPPSQRREVFKPFARGRDSGSGSGLGLAICRGFVEANGGRIHMQTGTPAGTSFAVSFPVARQPLVAS